MIKVNEIKIFQINNHVWSLTSPQIIDYINNKDGTVTINVISTIRKEYDLPKEKDNDFTIQG